MSIIVILMFFFAFGLSKDLNFVFGRCSAIERFRKRKNSGGVKNKKVQSNTNKIRNTVERREEKWNDRKT